MTGTETRKQADENGRCSTMEDIRRLLGEPVEVAAAGLRLRLTPPTSGQALMVRKVLFSQAPSGDSEGAILRTAAAAVKACLAGDLSDEEASRLVLRAGGETGALARQALKLCGLDELLGGASPSEQEEGDATPFGSPGKPDKR